MIKFLYKSDSGRYFFEMEEYGDRIILKFFKEDNVWKYVYVRSKYGEKHTKVYRVERKEMLSMLKSLERKEKLRKLLSNDS